MSSEIDVEKASNAPSNGSRPPKLTQEARSFLRAATGRTPSDDTRLSPQQESWLKHVQNQILKYPLSELRALLHRLPQPEHLPPQSILLREMFLLLTYLADIVVQEPSSSIDKVLGTLSGDAPNDVLKREVRDVPLKNRGRSLIFCCMSWMTMLYSTKFNADVDNLYLDHTQCPSIDFSKPADFAERPLYELLQDYGPLLPVKDDHVVETATDPVFLADSLYVSLLNAATLSQLGEITIEWIDNISCHLSFDPEQRKLLLFRIPSFCDVHPYKTTTLARILSEYYDDFNRPTAFDCKALLIEIRRSYHLIFSDDSASRSIYNRKERKRLRDFGTVDPYLDELCGVTKRKTNASERNSYSKITDFPIFASRLSRIQDYILRQNPKSLRMIWRDKRNPHQWYTFWAVVWIGGAGLFFSIAQTVLAAMQVYYTSQQTHGPSTSAAK